MSDAKKVAKQIAQEPFEILKQAGEQIVGAETPQSAESHANQPTGTPEVTIDQKAKIETQGKRRLQALEEELRDIRVLKEQKKVEEPQKEEPPKPLVEPATKRSRRLSGWGAKLKQLKTQTETRLPPSS